MARNRPAVAGLSAVLFVSSGCAIPDRDNLHDPALAPDAQFRIDPLEGSHDTVFTFNAEGSNDPRDRGELRYRFDLDGLPEGAPDFEIDNGASPVLPSTVPLSREELCGSPACDGTGDPIPRIVAVKVIAASGHSATIAKTILLRNRRPVVDPGEPIFVPKTPGLVVELDGCGGGTDCTSTDPDGDRLRSWNWSQVLVDAGDAVTLTPVAGTSGQTVSFVLPVSPRPLVFQVEASDGLALSERRSLEVHQDTQLWVSTRSPNRIRHIFPSFRVLKNPVPYQLGDLVHSIATDERDAFWVGTNAFATTGQVMVLKLNTSNTEETRWRIDPAGISASTRISQIAPVYGEAGSLEACAVVKNPGLPEGFLRLTPEDAGGFSGTSDAHLDSGALAVAAVAPGTAGSDCWTVSGAGTVGRLHSDGSWTQVASGLGNVYGAAGAQDGTLWVGGAKTTSPGLVTVWRFDPGGSSQTIDTTVPVTQISLNGRLVMTSRGSGRGVWVKVTDAPPDPLDAPALVRVGDTQDASPWVEVVPPVPFSELGTGVFLADPDTSSLWMGSAPQGALLRFLERDGELQLAGSLPVEQVVDDYAGAMEIQLLALRKSDGAVYAYAGTPTGPAGETEAYFALIPIHLRRDVTISDRPSPGLIRSDRVRGGAWVTLTGTAGTPVVVHLSEAGREITRFSPTGTLHAYEVTDEGALWDLESSAGTLSVVRRGRDGSETSRVPLGSIGAQASADLAVAGDTLCATSAWNDGGLNESAAFRYHIPTQSVQPLSVMVGTTAYAAGIVATSPDGTCWLTAKRSIDGQLCHPSFACTGQPASVLRYSPAAATPSSITATDHHSPLDLTLDPTDGGVWTGTFDYGESRILKVTPLGGVGGEILDLPGFGQIEPSPCPGASCVELFTNHERREVLGGLLDEYFYPGLTTSIDVCP